MEQSQSLDLDPVFTPLEVATWSKHSVNFVLP